ncbi:MAG TPA: EF-hand domain-containing protein [Acidimicrobiales bacterium]
MVDTERYATTFAMLDKDGDGRVSAEEFRELMATLGVEFTEENAAKAIEMMDSDGDGLVSLEELATYMSTPGAAQRPQPSS